ncbi:lipopolysaccharide assembly protein LapA domain-containing protein [Ideonella sp.]|jgi:putative membrane protein|uniref:lipopolysaccharide assembly protein LapA domain-containing protein n=1 Tax=Ideonella sp. TaxID=1929293 RepID=UPI0037C1A1CE
MRILVWLLRAFILFSLFAFSLNNLHTATLHWYFGQSWSAPMVMVVLAAFGAGAAFGVVAMAPSWWRQRQKAQLAQQSTPTAQQTASPSSPQAPVIPDGI